MTFEPSGIRGSSIRAPVVIGVIVVRYLLLPLVGIGIVKGAVLLGLVHDDPLYQFVLLVQYALPPAMNIGDLKALLNFLIFNSRDSFGWISSLHSES